MEKQGKIEWMEVLFWIIMIILFIMILTRVFGSSATDIQIYLGFISGLFMIMSFIAKHHREIGIIRVMMEERFDKIGESFNRVKEDMKRIENKIDNLSKNKTKK